MPWASQAMSELEAAPVIAVSRALVTLDGRTLEPTELSDLYDQLVTLKNNFGLLHPSEPFHATVIVAAEEDVGFATLKRILQSCALAGYPDVKLVVNRRG